MADKKDNSGILFKNDRKEKDTHPDSKGSCLIEGVEFWISGWTKTGEKGKFVSLAFQRKEQRAETALPAGNSDKPPIDDDSLPF